MLTANRATSLVFEPVTQYLLSRPTWYLKRKAHEMARGERRDRRTSQHTRMEATIDAWRLINTVDQIGRVTTAGFADAALGDADFNKATGVTSHDGWRKPEETGIGAGASVISNAAPTFRRTIPAGGDWSTGGLTRDDAPTPDEDDSIPLLRMLSSTVTYPANCGFVMIFGMGMLGGGWFNNMLAGSPPGSLFQFQFGGPTERVPEDADGGRYCLDVRTDGRAVLWEKVSRVRLEIPLSREDYLGSLWSVQPLGRSHLLISSLGGLDLWDRTKLQAFRRNGGPPTIAYRHTQALTGTNTVRYLTGAGTVALDVRRDFRGTVSIARSKFHPEGYVQDLDFLVPWPVIPAGTVLTMKVNSELVPGTEVTAQLFDATDDSELLPTGDPISATQSFAEYELAANQGKLYAKFTLTGDGDQTPLLYGYEVEVTGLRGTRTPTPISGGTLRTVSISGPDYDPSTAQAKAFVQDLDADLLTLLPVRGAVHAQIKTTYDALGNTTVLHDGILLDAKAKKRSGGADYPDTDWRDYDLSIGSMWVRIQRQLNLSPEQFTADPNVAPDPTTGKLTPWKITDIIRYCFRKQGWPDSQLDIPDLPIRLWPAEGTPGDLILTPTVNFAEFLLRLARDYLGMVLLWDPNAGAANGMWRLIYHPAAPYTALAAFVGAAAAGKYQSHPSSYGEAETFIISGTYNSWPVPPECNFVIVTATGELLPADGGAKLMVARIYNPVSFNFDPATPTADSTHPDYLGEFVPLVHFDPTLTTPEAVAYVARRLYDRTAHGEKWFTFQAPALYVADASDAQLLGRKRPLRINDVISVFGVAAMVKSVTYGYKSDLAQLMTIEGRFLV